MQGGTFTFVAPSFAILSLPHWKCPAPTPTVPPVIDIEGVTMSYVDSTASLINATLEAAMEGEDEPLWKPRIREVRGPKAQNVFGLMTLGVK